MLPKINMCYMRNQYDCKYFGNLCILGFKKYCAVFLKLFISLIGENYKFLCDGFVTL
jgi:hypothetical protein